MLQDTEYPDLERLGKYFQLTEIGHDLVWSLFFPRDI
jgi:hypothetical protein